ncbi:Mu transposase C-terminal domain-containing protein [Gallionella capsiferriformans]|uniref:Integrase catalytic region n=1 Tax=Gallionella capsiferriformans (strain ES-2) TaxID=395494 RepID=D9SFG0_GALCS|nr:Mu transposase C-terminal domain-containing protein [Gallionella capsiferriformans]ADL55257.1 Integrase catalytic region [Gallionella capsiferriformans ES-2]
MLLQNDILDYAEPEAKTIRILWIHPEMPVAFVIDVNAKYAVPELIQQQALESDLNSGRARVFTADPYLLVLEESAIPENRKQRRDLAWKAIADLVRAEPSIYSATYRAKQVAKCVAAGLATRPTLYLYLRRYWQRGQTPNALLPDYANSGGKGKSHQSKSDVKRGRPRKFGDQIGLNITEEIRKVFRVAVARYYTINAKFTLRGSYDQMIKEFFCERSINPETLCVTHSPKANMATTGFPTFNQFNYWLEQDNDRLDIKRKRLKPRIYDKDLRGLLGTSTAEVWGPGARYQIDATIADVYLVSRMDRHRIIGRPVLYVVIDVFSRMITGIYIGLEGPSWVGAMMALANTASDKQAFCKKFGRSIEPDEWPCRHLPASLLGDRGEIESRMIETLINNFNVTVETAAAFRADWKGIVEQRFKLLPAKFKPYVPGYIDVDFRARGGKDYRLDAVLDLDQFTQIIIEVVLYYNNHHELKRYDKDRDLAADNIPAVPIDLWEWGIANRSGSLRQYPENLVRFSLLPVDEATVTVNGIRFHGDFYTCQKTIEERWFDRARQRGNWKVKISYDPRNMDEIYLHDNQVSMQFQTCTMTERSRAHQQMSIWEIAQQQQAEQQVSAKRQPRQQLAAVGLSADIENIVDDAVKKKGEPSTASAASRTKNIHKHRADEKQSNRGSETFRFDTDKPAPAKSADILSFPRVVTDDYSEPDIMEIMGAKGDDDAKR